MQKHRRSQLLFWLFSLTLGAVGFSIPLATHAQDVTEIGSWSVFRDSYLNRFGPITTSCRAFFVNRVARRVYATEAQNVVSRAREIELPVPSREFVSRYANSPEGRALFVVAAAPRFFDGLGSVWRPVGVESRLGGVTGLAIPLPPNALIVAIHGQSVVSGRVLAHSFNEGGGSPVFSLETGAGAVTLAASELSLLHMYDSSADIDLVQALRALAVDSYRQSSGYNEFAGLGSRWRSMVHRRPTGVGEAAFISGRDFRVSSLLPGELVAMVTHPAYYQSPLLTLHTPLFGRHVGFVQSVDFDSRSRAWRMRLLQVDVQGREFNSVVVFSDEELHSLAKYVPARGGR